MSAAGDAQSDVMSGATLALMVLFVAILLYLLLLLAVFAEANTELRETLEALQTEEQQRLAEASARAKAEDALQSTSAELEATEARRQALEAAEAEARERQARAEARQRRMLRAMEEAAGRELSEEEVTALAEIGPLRADLESCEADLEQARAQAAAARSELERAEARLQTQDRALARAEALRREAEAAAASCGDAEGDLVATGMKLWVDGDRAIVTDAEPVLGVWTRHYTCTADPALMGGGGSSWQSGGTLGR